MVVQSLSMFSKLVTLFALISATFAAEATTTNYNDGTLGACGCGTKLNSYTYTAAGSPSIFGSGTWCGSGCGKCYTLTSTGTAPPGEGTGGKAGSSIMVIVTNLCPAEAPNTNWCPPAGQNNAYGYSAHFDINSASGNGGWSSLGWNNPIVDYSEVSCPSSVLSAYSGCECA